MPITPALFDGVDKFARTWASGRLSDRKKRILVTNPLVLFIESFLEQFSAAYLKTSVVGLTDRTGEQLQKVRRKLERRDKEPVTQKLLAELENFCIFVQEAGYGADEMEEDDFYFNSFPYFLETLARWLRNEIHDERLGKRAEGTCQLYAVSVLGAESDSSVDS